MNLHSTASVAYTGVALRERAVAALESARMQINRTYLSELDQYEVLLLPQDQKQLSAATDVRLYRLCRLVHENRQSVLESLTATYTALGASGYTVMLYLDSDGEKTDVFIGTRGEPARFEGDSAGALLQEAFRGHFAGSAMESLSAGEVEQTLQNLVSPRAGSSGYVSAVTGVPSLATEDVQRFAQGLERFLDAAERRRYRALILAEPLESRQLENIRAGYEQVATQLAPLQKMSWSFGDQDSYSVGITLSRSVGETLGQSMGLTETTGRSDTVSSSTTHTTGTSSGTQTATTSSKVAGVVTGISAAGIALAAPTGGISVPATMMLGSVVREAFSGSESQGTSTSDSTGTSNSVSLSSGKSKSSTTSRTSSDTVTDGRSDTTTEGSSRQLTLEFNDKGIEQLLLRINQHLARVEEARTYGGWSASAYFVADSKAGTEALSSIFLSLVRGKNSSQEDFAVTTWCDDARTRVLAWLGQLTHPMLRRQLPGHGAAHLTTPATLLSGREVALQLSLPRRSTSTVSVVETQAFGRRIQHVNGTVRAPQACTVALGRMRHLWENLAQPVALDIDQLCRHMFICGSTGSGKSNAIYNLLKQTHSAGVPFLVIEPAKGEYKHVLGHWPGVRVLGTNPMQAELLRINPFAFPDQIHVLEHVDRMVEIFNVCWPMYAAMPAVLKDAILQAYSHCGWDLDASCNTLAPRVFPGFADLMESLQRVIASSDYAEEAKSNYKGALGTRVHSLCNGLNARLFGTDALDDSALFDGSVVVDLSRVGSSETRALVMGMLVMRLSEHRMATGGMNQALRHVTVLEEAHNLLPCSVASGPEGGSIAGKSVEMLAAAIAEMRTYGEGFIIADQSPHAVDMAAIRNTNIKVVLRLPEETDRRLIGGSIGLNEGQMAEIARLPCGAAVIHQNDWLEPVLCQMDHLATESAPFVPTKTESTRVDAGQWRTQLANLLLARRVPRAPRVDVRLLRQGLTEMPLSSRVRLALEAMLQARIEGAPMPGDAAEGFDQLAALLVDAWGCRREVVAIGRNAVELQAMRSHLQRVVSELAPEAGPQIRLAVEQCMMRDIYSTDQSKKALYAEWHSYMTEETA